MNIALILSGGTGSRLGASLPKQYIEAGGKPVISYCLETLAGHRSIDAIQIVADEKWHDVIALPKKFHGFSEPGENRQLSILNGLTDIRRYAVGDDLVLIHDAARPMLSAAQISDILQAAEGHDGVMPVLPMKDTVYFSEDGKGVSKLLDRSKIFAGQAPEAFRLEPYYQANMALIPDDILRINGSTEPAIMAGLDIAMIPGDEANFKITTQEDLKKFQSFVSSKG